MVLALVIGVMSWRIIADVGLDYDEAVYGHLAKDFLLGRECQQHMPGSTSIEIGGRPFPVFVQGYLGAVKCWMLIPSFAVFGISIPVMRWTMFLGGLIAILFLMLWTRRALGFKAAILTGFLVGLDPAFLYPTVCEWGAFVPSFLCRCVGLFFCLEWWRRRKVWCMAVAGCSFGIGFFNKIDFLVILLALAVAVIVTRPRKLMEGIRSYWSHWLAGVCAFMLAAALMLVSLIRWIAALWEIQSNAGAEQFGKKVQILQAVLDGSYFLRLMESGGVFDQMFESSPAIHSPFGAGLVLALIVVIIGCVRDALAGKTGWPLFFLAGGLASTVGFFLLPDALRIHHALLLYPFPQLLIALAAINLWEARWSQAYFAWGARALLLLAIAGILGGHFLAYRRTQQFIRTTGGRGEWATALIDFAKQSQLKRGTVFVSLDWGFHEQLSFLTDSAQRFEPTWNLQEGKSVSLLRDPRYCYLIHPPEFSVFNYGGKFLREAEAMDSNLRVATYTNREGRAVFQTFQFLPPP